jgi:hypothetical protein
MNFFPPTATALRAQDLEAATWANFLAPDEEDYSYGGSDVETPDATDKTSRYWMAASPGVPFRPHIGEGNGDTVDDPSPYEATCTGCWLIVRQDRLNGHGYCNDCDPA